MQSNPVVLVVDKSLLASSLIIADLLAANTIGYCDKRQLTTPSKDPSQFKIIIDSIEGKLSIIRWGLPKMKPLSVDFTLTSKQYRSKLHRLQSELIVKACALNKMPNQTIFDATAGLGSDAFLLYSAGANLTMAEAHPIIYALLRDAVQRYNATNREHEDVCLASQKLSVSHLDSIDYMNNIVDHADNERPDVIYLDPMFAHKNKNVLAKRDMQIIQQLHHIMPIAANSDALLEVATLCAKRRVVVKRAVKSEYLANRTPSYSIRGKVIRFDVYLVCGE